MALGRSVLHPLDWLIIAGYLVVVVASGVVLSRRKQSDTTEYFLAGRRMPAWAVSLSLIATAISAATFIGLPAQSYAGDLTFMVASIGQVIAAVLIGRFFLPMFFTHNVSTVYELLGVRFGRPAKFCASGMFLVGRVLADGARVYIASMAVAMILFGELGDDPSVAWGRMMTAISVLMVGGIGYTLVGGIASVIWTNVVQAVVFLLAISAAIGLLIYKLPLEFPEILGLLADPGGGRPSKLSLIKVGLVPGEPWWGFDITESYTLLTALVAFPLFNMAAYGTDHELAQRMLTCSSSAKGSRSLTGAIFLGIPFTAMFLVIGLLLYVYHRSAGRLSATGDEHGVFLRFILHEMPPGLVGLSLAGLFAAALSSVNSSLNAMSATFVSDFYRPIKPGRDERHYLRVGRAAVVVWGVVQLVVAGLCVSWQRNSGQTLVDFALGVMTFAYSGLLAVFLAAVFTKRGSSLSAIVAMTVGFLLVVLLEPTVWQGLWGWSASGLGDTDWVRSMARLRVAYPWRMTLATVVAFGIVCIGRGQYVEADAQRDS